MNNTIFAGKKIEFHIIQSFPVTTLNRDDVGAPKTALVGGVTRARVSSQAWKRQVRLHLHDFGIKLAVRTKYISQKIQEACQSLGASEDHAHSVGEAIAEVLAKDTLYFFSDSEALELARYAQSLDFDPKKIIGENKKDLKKIFDAQKSGLIKGFKSQEVDGLDIALFGRMVALAPDLNVEAATSFAHAISTHKVANELDFFTAIDDLGSDTPASSHMGTLEFNSATYYRYVSLDLGQLEQNLGDTKHIPIAVSTFIKALYVAVPFARQSTLSGSSPWDYARVLVRNGQRIQAPFDKPVKPTEEGFSLPSINRLNEFLDRQEKLAGSLFGLQKAFRYGEDENYSIDDLITDLVTEISK
ncbi:type I-E CRISPR-associated protein Cas7/Cse4/CasC [Parasphaerochaeta coccoides]|uniref:CRISPR-associated protein, Cse4 family n=1 Tax=Parasphaerochaeta coccoides (strain ATCC BAA-1237 / DSM 17374 / SPN1) TaxID=760011 RepID=F4GL10_PARC1|nr:type I-E CRISPR-associated protein Cas7/Cse4/CasC [Parasphaerochaeta coccoides]AEC02350.1 CRISPR-associated protein, Cse4 family [Parasphaerochaeta coccoides DSM 17374]